MPSPVTDAYAPHTQILVPPPPHEPLPYTGLDVGAMLVGGLCLLLVGRQLRKLARV